MINNLKDSLELSKLEKLFYDQIWKFSQERNKDQDHTCLSANVAAEIMNRSGLQREVLKQIWKVSTKHSSKIMQDEFYLALKLISLQQNFISLTEENLNLYTILPKLDGIDQPSIQKDQREKLKIFEDEKDSAKFEIQEKSLQRIEYYIDNKCRTKTKGILLKQEAQELFNSAAQLDQTEQERLWQICDQENKNYLNRSQFIVALFLISLKKNGVSIANKLPLTLQTFIKNYSAKKNPPQHRYSMQNPKTPQMIQEYEKKFEGLMNLLLKKMFDQENKLQEFQQNQEEFLKKDDMVITKLEKLLQSCVEEDQKMNEQNNQFKVILEMLGDVQSKQKREQSVLTDKIDRKNQILNNFERTGLKILEREKSIEGIWKQVQEPQIPQQIHKNLNCVCFTSKILQKKIPTKSQELDTVSLQKEGEKNLIQNAKQEALSKDLSMVQSRKMSDTPFKDKDEEDDQQILDQMSQKALHEFGLKNPKVQKSQSLRNASIKALEEEVSKKGIDTIKEEEVDFEFMETQSNKKSVKSEEDKEFNKDEAKSIKIRSKSRSKNIDNDQLNQLFKKFLF